MKTIYFAHDQQDNPEVRKQFLELSGFVVKACKHYRELLAALKEGSPSLVLMDVLLEGKNGFEVAQEICQRYPERDFPIVLCSSIYRLHPFREEALQSGAQDYILLPQAPDEFLRRVSQAIAYFVPPEVRARAAEG